ncbi:MAG: prolyl oligopeptidase family serine peptidase [candidate division KSB1 bacterium]|nr:prolyl oligopeptidase family serine peptidase [candidate division KSB1 bacterium]MDZ7335508.1 prolyl oligopeptidase family serine peptidase [candidate division KSB1 bacterium]MDZ7401765.1 prolyl oligopeptidase family serine peptidase [candidate division KSB1 bacterium]
MKTNMILPALLILLYLMGCAATGRRTAKSGEQTAHQFQQTLKKTVSLNYLLFLPKDYSSTKKSYPLILFLHGAGERGDDLSLVKVHGIPKVVEQQPDFPFIAISPQCPSDRWWVDPWLLEALNALVDQVIDKYRVDASRVYLTGLSMGGFGTWALAMTFPEKFAAIAPICGGGMPWMAFRIKDVPVWVFHGAKDPVVPIQRSEEMVDALKKVGGNVKFTVYPDAGHDSWTETYNNPELYRWFLEHHK